MNRQGVPGPWPAACTALLGLMVAISCWAQTDPRRSSLELMSPSIQALQRDDTQNPGWLWLKAGEQSFNTQCIACHKPEQMRGVATRYPAWDPVLGKPVNLAGRINQCQQRHRGQAALALESEALLSLETFVAHQSRGQAIAPPNDPRLAPWRARGAALWRQGMGQVDLSCAQCHDQFAGGRLAGTTLPQAHPTAYPIYRLEWQSMGSLQRRLRSCLTGVRAEPFALGADEHLALELYLMQRAAGMLIETPGVRP